MRPELDIGPFVGLPTYFLYLSLVYSLLIYLAWRWAQKRNVSEIHALNISMLMVAAGMIGGRLLHVIYEAPEYYRQNPLDILKFWQGGFIFFGGFAAAILAGLIYVRKNKLSFLEWADFFAPLGAFGYGIGRFACFLAGCCYGRYCDLPWAIQGRHPVQLYAVIIEVLFSIFLWRWSLRPHTKGRIFFTWLAIHSIARLFMESLRDDFRGAFPLGISISSWLSLFLMSAALTALIIPKRPQHKS